MYHKILVPLDGSKRAEAILPHVEQLAQRYGSVVILCQVVAPIPPGVGADGAHLMLTATELTWEIEEAESYLARWQAEFEKRGLKAVTQVVRGCPADAIIEVAESEKADLIAMASHGRTGLSRVFYGSVAAAILNRVDRPLLLVRSRDDD